MLLQDLPRRELWAVARSSRVIPAAAGVMAWAALGEQLSAPAIAGLVLGAAACVLQARSGGAAGRRASGEHDHRAERPALSRSAE